MVLVDPRVEEVVPDVDVDASIVDEVRAGVRSAHERLIRRHNQQLYRIARAQLGNDDEAEDVTQQAWVQIFSSLAQWSGRGSFSAWAATIVVNGARARRKAAIDLEPLDEEELEPTTAPGPDEEALRKQVRQVLERTVDALNPTLRVVFVMFDVEGFSGAEVANALGISEQLVRVRLHRARQSLQRSLDEQFSGEARALYPFMGIRCDRITHAVLEQLGALDA